MGLFDKFKKNKADENANKNIDVTVPDDYADELKNYCTKYIEGPLNEVSTQKKLFSYIAPVLYINELLLGMNVQKIFATNTLTDINILQLQGHIAASTDRWSGNFKENVIPGNIRKSETETLLRCFCTLSYYCDILKPEYKINLDRYRTLILKEIYSRNFEIPKKAPVNPVSVSENCVHINSQMFLKWCKENPSTPQFEFRGAIKLTEKEPTICIYEDNIKTQDYVLETEGDEDFSGKYFLISVRLGINPRLRVPYAQIDGFVSDTPDDREFTNNDTGYRMEVHFLACGGEISKNCAESNKGQDLTTKALKYPGYTTPSNIRLIGVCPECGKSFCFHGYAFYMIQSDVAYSDDGLDCCEIVAFDIDKDTWSYQVDDKTFRYYNSFACPHCKTPYIDYKKYPQNKVFGVSGCVLLNKTHYRYT